MVNKQILTVTISTVLNLLVNSIPQATIGPGVLLSILLIGMYWLAQGSRMNSKLKYHQPNVQSDYYNYVAIESLSIAISAGLVLYHWFNIQPFLVVNVVVLFLIGGITDPGFSFKEWLNKKIL
jgi:hypothetical protein